MLAQLQERHPNDPSRSAELRLRWALDTHEWNPTETQLSDLIARLPSEDQETCNRFMRMQDRKRAVASRMLQRAFGSIAFDQPLAKIFITRTGRGKPFFTHEHPVSKSLNFNVSHEGDWVVLASDPQWLCGVDIAAPDQLHFAQHLPLIDRMRMLQNCFSEPEVCYPTLALRLHQRRLTTGKLQFEIAQTYADNEVALEHYFRHLWSLKESFLKARGDGLRMSPARASFSIRQLLPCTSVPLPPAYHLPGPA